MVGFPSLFLTDNSDPSKLVDFISLFYTFPPVSSSALSDPFAPVFSACILAFSAFVRPLLTADVFLILVLLTAQHLAF